MNQLLIFAYIQELNGYFYPLMRRCDSIRHHWNAKYGNNKGIKSRFLGCKIKFNWELCVWLRVWVSPIRKKHKPSGNVSTDWVSDWNNLPVVEFQVFYVEYSITVSRLFVDAEVISFFGIVKFLDTLVSQKFSTSEITTWI